MKPISVCGAIIRNNRGQYLVTSRPEGKPHAGQWEFPGGKTNPGESCGECLKREIYEELLVDVLVLDQVYQITYSYPDKTVKLYFFRCILENHEQPVTPMENQLYKWCIPEELLNIVFLPADRPLAEYLTVKENFSENNTNKQ